MPPERPRVAPADPASLTPDQSRLLAAGASLMGFTPNDGLTMARVPGLLEGASGLVGAVFGPGKLDPEIRRLVAVMSSEAAGCRYCQAHTKHGALRDGIDPARLRDLWTFETSAAFDPAQRAAMKVAWLASLTPNQVKDEHFAALRQRFGEDEVLEIVAVIALFGFLNRWNDTLKTAVENEPAARLAEAGVGQDERPTAASEREPQEPS